METLLWLLLALTTLWAVVVANRVYALVKHDAALRRAGWLK